jgi:hypothetical protein
MNTHDFSLIEADLDLDNPWEGSAMHSSPTHPIPASLGYLSRSGVRKDAFYLPTDIGPKTTITLALCLENPQPSQTPSNNQGHTTHRKPRSESRRKSNSTIKIVPRLFFPAEKGNLDAYGWGSRNRRNAAATWIEGNLDKLQSENLLTTCAASTVGGTTKLLEGTIRGFKLSLGTILRDPKFAPSSVGVPVPTFVPRHSKIPISRLSAVPVDGVDYKLSLRTAYNTHSQTDWEDGRLYSEEELETVLVPLGSNDVATLDKSGAEVLQNAITKMKLVKLNAATYQYPAHIKEYKFGDVALWGPNEASTAASSSAAAN